MESWCAKRFPPLYDAEPCTTHCILPNHHHVCMSMEVPVGFWWSVVAFQSWVNGWSPLRNSSLRSAAFPPSSTMSNRYHHAVVVSECILLVLCIVAVCVLSRSSTQYHEADALILMMILKEHFTFYKAFATRLSTCIWDTHPENVFSLMQDKRSVQGVSSWWVND